MHWCVRKPRPQLRQGTLRYLKVLTLSSILLVLCLEFLRRAGKEYDRYIVEQHKRSLAHGATSSMMPDGGKHTTTSTATPIPASPFRPNVLQQAMRALLHMLQFAVAYFVMLLAMYVRYIHGWTGHTLTCIKVL
jgi:hypothetical protein